MTPDEISRLQSRLNDEGLGPLKLDGVYGPLTAKSYKAHLADSQAISGAPVPDPSKAWWRSKGMLGSLAVVLVGVFGLADWGLDSESLTQLFIALSTVAGGVVAAVGRAKATAPIDPTRVASGIRIGPTGLYRVKPDE